MSSTDASNTRDNPALCVPCPWCSVPARRLCRFPGGGLVDEVHEERLDLLKEYEALKRGVR